MAHKLVTLIRNLQRRNARRRLRTVTAEGVRLVEEALRAEVRFEGAVLSPALDRTERGRDLSAALTRAGVPCHHVTDASLRELADTESPQGILAVVELPDWRLTDVRPERGRPVLAVDGVQDPGNVGALIRTSCGLGAAGTILLPGTAQATNPKVLRGAMGTTFRHPVVGVDTEAWRVWIDGLAGELWVAETGGDPIGNHRPPERLVIVVGNEGGGVGPATAERATHRVGVRLANSVESLNVSVAAGIVLHEVMRGY